MSNTIKLNSSEMEQLVREEYEAACKEDPEFAEEMTFEEFKSEVFVENLSGRE